MPRKQLFIIDNTARDAIQAKLALMVGPAPRKMIVEAADEIGFFALENAGGGLVQMDMLEHGVNPFQSSNEILSAARNTASEMLFRGKPVVGLNDASDEVAKAVIERVSDTGRRNLHVRGFDALNDTNRLWPTFEVAQELGLTIQAAMAFTAVPGQPDLYDDEYYVRLAQQFREKLGDKGWILTVKDMTGVMPPDRPETLLPRLFEIVGPNIPINLHCHSSTGYALDTYRAAMQTDVPILIVDGAISSLSGGPGHPAIEDIIKVAAETGRDIGGLRKDKLPEYAALGREIREKHAEHDTMGEAPNRKMLESPIPGGMISNLKRMMMAEKARRRLGRKITDVGDSEKRQALAAVQPEVEALMPKVIEEYGKVWTELGHPLLVTPTSQVIGNQAARNVDDVEAKRGRYTFLNTDFVDLLVGRYGRLPYAPDGKLLEEARKKEKPPKVLPGMAELAEDLRGIAVRQKLHIPAGVVQDYAMLLGMYGQTMVLPRIEQWHGEETRRLVSANRPTDCRVVVGEREGDKFPIIAEVLGVDITAGLEQVNQNPDLIKDQVETLRRFALDRALDITPDKVKGYAVRLLLYGQGNDQQKVVESIVAQEELETNRQLFRNDTPPPHIGRVVVATRVEDKFPVVEARVTEKAVADLLYVPIHATADDEMTIDRLQSALANGPSFNEKASMAARIRNRRESIQRGVSFVPRQLERAGITDPSHVAQAEVLFETLVAKRREELRLAGSEVAAPVTSFPTR